MIYEYDPDDAYGHKLIWNLPELREAGKQHDPWRVNRIMNNTYVRLGAMAELCMENGIMSRNGFTNHQYWVAFRSIEDVTMFRILWDDSSS